MPHLLEAKLAAAWPPSDWADVTVVAGVSGGCDSVALLRALVALSGNGGGRIRVAHLNHQLRPDAGDDERFVVELCDRLQVGCEVGRVDVARLTARSGDGLEAAARWARYKFLAEAAGRLGARFVITAHTADDQVETVLHRIVRGTGLRGLSGMPRSRPLGHATLIRPLLGVGRAELRAYLGALGQPYRDDPSNAEPHFTRNRVRRDLLPQLREHFNADADAAILRLGLLAGEAQGLIDRLVEEWFDRCVRMDPSGAARIELGLLADQPRYLLRELLISVWRRAGWPMQSMGLAQWEQLAEAASRGTASGDRAAAAPAATGLPGAMSFPLPRHFPGGVCVEIADGIMTLRRPGVNQPRRR
jgi:tRNA(Ile)-lysidine synthase